MHFSAFGRDIHCETTPTRKVTVKPFEIHTTAGTIDNLSIIDIFFFVVVCFLATLVRFEPAWQRYPASQS